MKVWDSPFIGVLGGLGPGATALFMDLLVKATKVNSDQDHIDAIVMQHSSTPDRTSHILDPQNSADPGPSLVKDAKFLDACGAEFLVLPCNTAHHYTEQVEQAITSELLSIVEVTVAAAVQRLTALGKPDASIAIFATEGSVQAEVYQKAIAEAGKRYLVPNSQVQAVITSVIYDQVKAGKPADVTALNNAVEQMQDAGAEVVIFGCTELSIVFDEAKLSQDSRIVDSLLELTKATVLKAGKELSDQLLAQ